MDSDVTYKLSPKLTIKHNSAEIFCLRFSPDGQYLVAGCGDGSVKVYNTRTGVEANKLQEGSSNLLPVTAIEFRPTPPSAEARTRNVFIAANTNGKVQHWHMNSGKCLHTMGSKDDDQIYALSYDSLGSKFVTAGRGRLLKLYDEDTKTLVSELTGGSGICKQVTAGHSNRIFAAKFVPGDNNLIITGGWDSTVQVWDVRVGHSVRDFYGPHICGDALDISGGTVLTGSWRPEDQLEMWDFASGKRIEIVSWNSKLYGHGDQEPCLLYAAQFSKGTPAGEEPRFIAAGGSGRNEAKVFDHLRGNEVVGTITGLRGAVFATDFSPVGNEDGHMVAFGGSDASLRVVDIVPVPSR